MNTLSLKTGRHIPYFYTGIVEWEHGDFFWLKNGNLHREDGPAVVRKDETKEWWLDGQFIFSSNWYEIYLRDKIILSKDSHIEYPVVQIWKYISQYGIKKLFVIPGMVNYIIE